MELTKVTVPGDDSRNEPASPAVAILPAGAQRGVVVIHEIFGPTPEIDRVLEKFAAAGYAAIAPNLFHRGTAPCMISVVRSARTGADTAPVRQARRARSWLCEQAKLPAPRVGLIGFCFGGLFVLTAGRGWGAVSTNYGEVPESEAMRGIGPVIGCYGGRDRTMSAKPARLRKRLARVGAPAPEIHEYPDAGHSFLTDGNRPIARVLTWPLLHLGHHAPSADDAWPKILNFFARHL